jgi:hypothetical protein
LGQHRGGLLDTTPSFIRRHLRHLEREAHVVGHAHVGVERVVLEHHRDVPVLGGDMGDVPVAEQDPALVDLFQPGQHPQGRGLPAARGPDEHHELAVADLEIDTCYRR